MTLFYYGEDTYSLQDELKRLKKKARLDNSDVEEFRFDADLSDSEIERRLKETLENQGLFAAKKLVLLRGFVDALNKLEKTAGFLEKYIASESKDIDMVFVELGRPDGRKKFFKTLKKQANAKEFNIPTDRELVMWVEDYIKNNGGSIEPEAVGLFCRMLTSEDEREILHDLWQVKSELDKLLLYAHDRKIGKKDVELAVSANSSENVFLLTNAFAGGDSREATRFLEQIVGQGNPADMKGRVIKLMGALASQIHSLMLVKSVEDQAPEKIAESLGWKQGRVWITLKLAKKFSQGRLQSMLADLSAIDKRIKTSDESPKLLLTLFLQKTSSPS